MPDAAEATTKDGLAIAILGDTMLTVWQAPARIQRIQRFFETMEPLAAKQKNGVLLLQVILPSSDPPDGPARAENATRLRKLAPSLRRIVTVPIGDVLRASLVRTIMRAMLVVQGQSHLQFVAKSLDEGIKTLLEKADPSTPTAPQIVSTIQGLHRALGIDPT